MWLLLMLAALSQPSIDTLRNQSFEQVGNWTVLKNGAQAECRVIAKYESGPTIVVFYNVATGRADLAFANDNWKSLRTGQKKQLQLTFFPRGQWASGNATVVTSSSDESVALSLGFENGSEILNFISEARTFNLTIDGISVGIWTLQGSRNAIESLKRCAVQAFAEGAKGDPFAPLGSTKIISGNHQANERIKATSSVWVQLAATSAGPRALQDAVLEIRRKHRDVFDGVPFYVSPLNGGYRILVGPFRALTDATIFADDLHQAKIPTEVWINPPEIAVVRLK